MDEPYDPTTAPTIGAPQTSSGPGLPQSAAPRAGTQFGGYHLIRLLGHGGFGQVWEAESLETGRRLALKVLTHTRALAPDVLQRFRQEGRLAASLSHPQCVYIFGAEAIHGYPMISMELMSGGTLQDRLAAEGPPAPRQAVDYMLDVLDGLEAAQNVGIIHRDVKPSNCFLDAGLVEELETRAEHRVASGQLSLAHVWIDAHGRPRLLDFAAPSTAKLSGPEAGSCPDWKTFLHQVLLFCLEGCAVAPGQLAGRPPRVPLPVFARAPVRRLCGLDGAYESISALRADLETVAQQPAEVTRAKRAVPLAAAALPALLAVVFALLLPLMVPAMMRQLDSTPEMGDLMRLEFYLQELEQIEKDLPQKTGEERRRAEAEREALRKVMASAHASAQASAQGQQIRRQWPPKIREAVERARGDYAALSKAELAEARRTARPISDRRMARMNEGWRVGPTKLLLVTALLLGLVGVAGVVLAPMFRGGVMLYLFGIGMQRKDGQPAGRMRCMLRALLAWSAVLAAAAILLLPGQTTAVRASVIGVLLAAAAAGAVYAVVYPEGGLADRIAGTRLVPR